VSRELRELLPAASRYFALSKKMNALWLTLNRAAMDLFTFMIGYGRLPSSVNDEGRRCDSHVFAASLFWLLDSRTWATCARALASVCCLRAHAWQLLPQFLFGSVVQDYHRFVRACNDDDSRRCASRSRAALRTHFRRCSASFSVISRTLGTSRVVLVCARAC
jgi:hypothetical protein